jgi:hypothetical protein
MGSSLQSGLSGEFEVTNVGLHGTSTEVKLIRNMSGSDWLKYAQSFRSYPIGPAQKYAVQLPRAGERTSPAPEKDLPISDLVFCKTRGSAEPRRNAVRNGKSAYSLHLAWLKLPVIDTPDLDINLDKLLQ